MLGNVYFYDWKVNEEKEVPIIFALMEQELGDLDPYFVIYTPCSHYKELYHYLKKHGKLVSGELERTYRRNCNFKTKFKPSKSTEEEIDACIDLRVKNNPEVKEYPYYQTQFQTFSTYLLKKEQKVVSYINYHLDFDRKVCDFCDLLVQNPKERLALIQKMFADAYEHGMKKTVISTINQNEEIDQWKQQGCRPVCYVFELKNHQRKDF